MTILVTAKTPRVDFFAIFKCAYSLLDNVKFFVEVAGQVADECFVRAHRSFHVLSVALDSTI